MNAIPMRHPQANETSQHIMTLHMRHIFMPVNQTNKKIIYLMQLFIKCNNSITFMLQPKENLFDCYNNQSHFV